MSENENEDEHDYQYMILDGSVFIHKYKGYGGHVVVPDTLGGFPVTAIGHSAFAHNTEIDGITLPESLLHLGNLAFYNCHGMTSVIVGNSVTSIGDSAFLGCPLLEEIKLPASVTRIGNYVLPFRGPPEKELEMANWQLKYLRRSLVDLIGRMDDNEVK